MFPADPRPHIPVGFDWVQRIAPREPRRTRVFLGPFAVKANENMAIAITEPRVHPDDFPQLAQALHSFLQDEHQVCHLEIQRCPLGEAYVRFGSPLERTRFIRNSPMPFGQYHIGFIKHDEGANVKAINMDREVWLMLLAYPNDHRSTVEIDKSIASFAILRHVHKSTNDARVIVKAAVNKLDDIPDEIVVSPGDTPCAPSWTVPVYVLHHNDIGVLTDEDPLPDHGPLHPLPHSPPRLIEAPADGSVASSVHEAPTVDMPVDAPPHEGDPMNANSPLNQTVFLHAMPSV